MSDERIKELEAELAARGERITNLETVNRDLSADVAHFADACTAREKHIAALQEQATQAKAAYEKRMQAASEELAQIRETVKRKAEAHAAQVADLSRELDRVKANRDNLLRLHQSAGNALSTIAKVVNDEQNRRSGVAIATAPATPEG